MWLEEWELFSMSWMVETRSREKILEVWGGEVLARSRWEELSGEDKDSTTSKYDVREGMFGTNRWLEATLGVDVLELMQRSKQFDIGVGKKEWTISIGVLCWSECRLAKGKVISWKVIR